MHAVLQLIRFPLTFTAIADVIAAYLLAQATSSNLQIDFTFTYIMITSAALYSLGMILNDIVDYKKDTKYHPHRPIPSKVISRGSAIRLSIGLFLLLLVLTIFMPKYSTYTIVTLLLLVILYNFLTKKHPLLGSLNMGACRFFNFTLGMSVHPQFTSFFKENIHFPLILSLFVTIITYVSTYEEKIPKLQKVVHFGLSSIILLDAMFLVYSQLYIQASFVLSLYLPLFVFAAQKK